jgi:hypothetical protein
MNKTTSSRARGSRDLAKEKFWRGMLRRFAAGGMSVRAFCRQHHLSEPSFYSWRRTIAGRDGAGRSALSRPRPSAPSAPSAPPSAPAFLPVHVAKEEEGDPKAAGSVEVLLAGGMRILLHGPVDRAALIAVVTALHPAAKEQV